MTVYTKHKNTMCNIFPIAENILKDLYLVTTERFEKITSVHFYIDDIIDSIPPKRMLEIEYKIKNEMSPYHNKLVEEDFDIDLNVLFDKKFPENWFDIERLREAKRKEREKEEQEAYELYLKLKERFEKSTTHR
jgi:hypothetical protein